MKVWTSGLDRLNRLARKISSVPGGTAREMERVTDKYGEILFQTVKRNASGRPGPNIVTGEYLSNFELRHEGSLSRRVVNYSPQTRRLERGFVGVDSSGRHYDQPPYPHFGPALQEVKPKYIEEMKGSFRRVWDEA